MSNQGMGKDVHVKMRVSAFTIPEIHCKVVPHENQRYETPGDYFFDENGKLHFRVSAMANWRYEFLILLHELVEWGLVKHAGVEISYIDEFDKQFEADREKGLHKNDEEPGDDKKAPYYHQHQFASKVEKMAARMLGVNWRKYGDTVAGL